MLNPCTEHMYITMSCMIEFHNNYIQLSHDPEPVLVYLEQEKQIYMKKNCKRDRNRI
jgi:hypothetical protein